MSLSIVTPCLLSLISPQSLLIFSHHSLSSLSNLSPVSPYLLSLSSLPSLSLSSLPSLTLSSLSSLSVSSLPVFFPQSLPQSLSSWVTPTAASLELDVPLPSLYLSSFPSLSRSSFPGLSLSSLPSLSLPAFSPCHKESKPLVMRSQGTLTLVPASQLGVQWGVKITNKGRRVQWTAIRSPVESQPITGTPGVNTNCPHISSPVKVL